MTGTVALALVLLVAAGAALSIQGPINAALARGVGDAAVAGCISFFVGFLVLGVVSLARGVWPATIAWSTVPWWAWIGGFFGGFYVFALTWSVPKIGVLSVVAALVLGQLVAAIVLDLTGALGIPVHPVSATRILGTLCVLGGLLLTRI